MGGKAGGGGTSKRSGSSTGGVDAKPVEPLRGRGAHRLPPAPDASTKDVVIDGKLRRAEFRGPASDTADDAKAPTPKVTKGAPITPGSAQTDAGELTLKGKILSLLKGSKAIRAKSVAAGKKEEPKEFGEDPVRKKGRSKFPYEDTISERTSDNFDQKNKRLNGVNDQVTKALERNNPHPVTKFKAGGELSPYGEKGSLILKVGDHTVSRLFFTRVPSNWESKVKANLSRTKIPGASAESIQKLGSGSLEYKMKVLFSNAWAPVKYTPGSKLKNTRTLTTNRWTSAGAATKLLIDLVRTGWQGSMYWDKGGSEQIVPIILESVQLTEGVFIPPGKSAEFTHLYGANHQSGKLGGDPQHVEATLSFIVAQEYKYYVPYKSRRRTASRRKRRKPVRVFAAVDDTITGGERAFTPVLLLGKTGDTRGEQEDLLEDTRGRFPELFGSEYEGAAGNPFKLTATPGALTAPYAPKDSTIFRLYRKASEDSIEGRSPR